MNSKSLFVRALMCFGAIWLAARAAAAEIVVPQVIQAGMGLWAKGGPDIALDTWQKGGLLEGDNSREAGLVAYFRRIDRLLGNYQNFEAIDAKPIGKTSQIVYLSMNFERGAVFAKFTLYRTAKDGWVVQHMDFNTRPEAIMPWLAVSESAPAE